MTPIKFLIVEDHPLMLAALSGVVRAAFPEAKIVEATSQRSATEAVEQEISFDLVLLDLQLPDTMGADGLLALKATFPDLKIVVVSAFWNPHTVLTSMALGASGFLPKSLTADELTRSIRHGLAGVRVLPESMSGFDQVRARLDDKEVPFKPLSPRQARVLKLVCDGLLNKQIAYELGVGETTIKAHMREVLRKLNVNSRTNALINVTNLQLPLSDETPSTPRALSAASTG